MSEAEVDAIFAWHEVRGAGNERGSQKARGSGHSRGRRRQGTGAGESSHSLPDDIIDFRTALVGRTEKDSRKVRAAVAPFARRIPHAPRALAEFNPWGCGVVMSFEDVADFRSWALAQHLKQIAVVEQGIIGLATLSVMAKRALLRRGWQ